jgi:2-amino-4-hydroxy-6-hydroxymethyldihydropteridine diphosphokinase
MTKARSSCAEDGEELPQGDHHLYAIGLGSNKPLRGMTPRDVVAAALHALSAPPLELVEQSPVIASRPLGPSARTYANAAAIVASSLPPLAMLNLLQSIELKFHRRRFRRWGARTLDLDLLLWSGGKVQQKRLTVPHPAFRERSFVLEPLGKIAPRWRDPVTGRTIAQLAAMLNRRLPLSGRSSSDSEHQSS